jgi:hypothetical protein
MYIPDPNFSVPDPNFCIPDPRSKRHRISDIDPECLFSIWIFSYPGSRGFKKAPDPGPGSATLEVLKMAGLCLGAISVEDEDGRVIKLDPEDQALRTMVANTLLTPSYREK